MALFSSATAMAAPANLFIALEQWENYSNPDGSGYYLELMREIYQPKGITVNYKLVPYKRSIEMLASHKVDAIMGAYKGMNIPGMFSEQSLDLDKVDAFISPQLNQTWQGTESLTGQRVGSLKGYEFDRYVEMKLQYQEQPTLVALLKMLDLGRLDAIVGYEADIAVAQKILSNDAGYAPNYVIKRNVLINSSYAVFADTERGRAMLKIFNEGILDLHESGRLKTLMLKNVGSLSNYPEIKQ